MTTLRTIADVFRGEGAASALRRTRERIAESAHDAALLARGRWTTSLPVARLDVIAAGASTRLGGVQAQLAARMDDERAEHPVALLRPGMLELSHPVPHVRRVARDFDGALREALAITGARTVQFDGMSDVPLRSALQLIESGVAVTLRLHDFSLFCARPNLLEEPAKRFCEYSEDRDRCARCLGGDDNSERRALARTLLLSAQRVVVPSQFLLDEHRRLFALPDLAADIVEPRVRGLNDAKTTTGAGIAFAGAVRHHKGAHLLPEIAQLSGATIHVFGGGDVALLRELRREPRLILHGYYRTGTLPALLRSHGIGLVLVPSICPEAFVLVLSEAWSAGASVAAFDLGAPGARIRQNGQGWVTPLGSGAAGFADIIRRWRSDAVAGQRRGDAREEQPHVEPERP